MTELDAFAVGLRRGQSEERANVEKVATDGPRLKLSPLAEWNEEQIERYLIEHQTPVHPDRSDLSTTQAEQSSTQRAPYLNESKANESEFEFLSLLVSTSTPFF